MKSRIIILSNSIQSGKTTHLLNWINGKQNIAGILTPDIDYCRNLFDIEQNKFYPFEVKNPQEMEGITSIGKFHFNTAYFELAQQIIQNKNNKEYLIIDEIGKLELLQNKGLEPILSHVIKKYTQNKVNGTLVLVIRNYLLETAIKKYELHNAQIVQSMEEINQSTNLLGLVLAGGNSARMETDKAFLNYHGKEQIYYLAQKLKPLCKPIFISVNERQTVQKSEDYQVVCDSATYKNIGPIGALLTACQLQPNKAFLVIGCDYPLINYSDIILLKLAFKKHQKTVTFYNPETHFREPLLGIYHPNDLDKLHTFFQKGNASLRYFLDEINAIKIEPTQLDHITSVDNKNDYNKTKHLITNLL